MSSERAATDTPPSGAAAASPLSRSSLQDEINSRIYHARGVTNAYRSRLLLNRPEAMALLRYQPGFFGRSVLDIGIGTGRTAGFLQPLAQRYVCIDYSQEMVDHVRKALPGVEVHLADMRDLSRWAAAEFDFIFAPDNVFDAVSHEDRLRILAEARRVLSAANKTFILKGARATNSRRPLDSGALFDEMAGAWERGMKAMESVL